MFRNIGMLSAYEHLTYNQKLITSSMERISSGLRITKASDDPSGLAIADKLRTQASSIAQSIKNANSAIALIQIADKAMAEQSNILDTVRVKLIQARTATTSLEGREAIRKDIVKLLSGLDNIASQTNYNGVALLQKGDSDTTPSDQLTFQIGERANNTISTDGNVQSNTVGLGLDSLKGLSADTLDPNTAANWFDKIDSALNKLNNFRADFGSTQNQLESSIRYMNTMHTQLKSSESVIRDVDYAQEVANLQKLQLIMQAGMFAFTQANKLQEMLIRQLLR
jgi:flagellin